MTHKTITDTFGSTYSVSEGEKSEIIRKIAEENDVEYVEVPFEEEGE